MNNAVEKIKKDVENLSNERYLKGVYDTLQVFNEKFLENVWHKEDSEKLFDEFFETLEKLNIRYHNLKNIYPL